MRDIQQIGPYSWKWLVASMKMWIMTIISRIFRLSSVWAVEDFLKSIWYEDLANLWQWKSLIRTSFCPMTKAASLTIKKPFLVSAQIIHLLQSFKLHLRPITSWFSRCSFAMVESCSICWEKWEEWKRKTQSFTSCKR